MTSRLISSTALRDIFLITSDRSERSFGRSFRQFDRPHRLVFAKLISLIEQLYFFPRCNGTESRKFFEKKAALREVLTENGLSRKTTAIERTAVRETDVSRHHGGNIEGPLIFQEPSEHYRVEKDLNWAPINPRYASLSDSRCIFLQAGKIHSGKFLQEYFPREFAIIRHREFDSENQTEKSRICCPRGASLLTVGAQLRGINSPLIPSIR